jgi:hypothetical protein
MSKTRLLSATGFLCLVLFLSACSVPAEPQTIGDTTDSSDSSATSKDTMAFLYQYVGNMVNGTGDNGVTLGSSSDGLVVRSSEQDAALWTVSKSVTDVYGDPVFSHLSNGNWALTAWTGHNDTRGANYLLYYEASCPIVDDSEVLAIGTSSATGCKDTKSLTGGKTSQIFAADDGNYVFHMIGGSIYLAHLSDATHSAMDLESICVLDEPVEKSTELDYGASTLILDQKNTGLLMSDTAMGRRADGTWVLFVKGIAPTKECSGGNLCELCGRSIYRTTSTDLIHWTDLEKVVTQASVPEATTTADGTVWLYWQNFNLTCDSEDMRMGATAPISGAYEQAGTYELSEPVDVSFPDEAFQTDSQLHYATNANPVVLDAEAMAAYEACME